MPPTRDQLLQFIEEGRTRDSYDASLNTANQVDPPRARADSDLRIRANFPVPIWDSTTRDMAQMRVRQEETSRALNRAPSLSEFLANPNTYPLIADDIGPLSNVVKTLHTLVTGGGPSQADITTDRLIRQNPALARYRGIVNRAYQGYYSPNNPLRVAGNVVAGAVVSANEGATGMLGAAYDLITGRTFGLSSVRDDLTAEMRRQGAPIPQDFEPDPVRRYLGSVRNANTESAQAHRIDTGNQYLDSALQGLQSVPLQLAALYMAGRGDTHMALGLMSAMTGGQSYGDAQDAGLSPLQSLNYAVTQGSLEALGEVLPIFAFAHDAARGSGFFRTLGRQLFAENAGEQFTQHAQDFVQWAAIESNRGKTFGDYLAERPQVALQTLIATTAAVGVQTPAARAMLHAAQQAGEADQAQVSSGQVDQLMRAAADSRLRKESPEDFRRLIDQQLQDAPNDNLYFPAEQVRALFQSPQDMEEDPFWGDYAEQISAAELLNGDVVVPLAAAATHLAGSPQWEALKDHVRTSGGGMSRTEAKEAELAFFDALQQSGEELAAEHEADRQGMEPAQKVYEAMRDKLLLAGFRADAASQMATQFATRQRVRAQRVGRPLTGAEADSVEVRQVLPENLAQAIKAADVPDAGLRSVIAMMRRGSAPRSDRARFGPSLLEFIAKRGGIEDRGGDLASMGADRWHLRDVPTKARRKTKGGKSVEVRVTTIPGRRKLIRPHDDSPDLVGGRGNDNSPDALALAAWEAGYFPNHPERPTVDDLLQAIGGELAGTPVYADDRTNEGDVLREAAQELYALLDQKGLDPERASDAEIARTVSQYQAERSAGRGYDQTLFDGPFAIASIKAEARKSGVHIDAHLDSGTIWLNSVERLPGSSPGAGADAVRAVLAEADRLWIPVRLRANAGAFEQRDSEKLISYYERLGFERDSQKTNEMTRQPVGQPERSMTQAQRAEIEARQLQSKARRGGQESIKDQTGGLFSSERDQDSLFQSYGDGPRGRITFGTDGRAVIDLFEARDLSTFIHESGHLYLEELKADAEIGRQLDTPEGQQLAVDFETVKAWFASEGHAVGEDGTIPTEAHEMFARGFERYAMEGKAPSSTLRRAFEAFRSWLITIYKNVTSLKAPITPEIRDVMARLMATDEEIAAAKEEQNIKLGFTSAAEAGMTDAEYEAYRTAATDATDSAHSALLKKVMGTVRARRTKEYHEQERGVRAEITQSIDAQPVFRALAMLRNKETPAKLDKQFLIDSYGGLDQFPQGVPPIYSDTNTVHPDIIAEETGFTSGDEMIRTLIGHELARKETKANGDKRSPRQIAIDEGTAAAMAERYGDPLRDGSIEEEARALLYNDRQGEVLATELRALARQTGRRPTAYSIARKWAGERVAASRVVDSASGAAIERYQKAARKSGKAFEEALAKGDKDEAFKHKQAQMLNNALVAAAKEAKDRVDVAVRRLGKLAKAKTRKSTDQAYLDQAHALLEQVEFRPRSQADIDEQETFEAFARKQAEAGIDMVVPPSFAASLGKTHWSRLSVEQLTGLDATVQQILHLGRNAQSVLDGIERRSFQESKDALEASADGSGKGRKVSRLNDPSRSLPEVAKSKIRWADAAMIKAETIFDWMDGGDSNGPWNRLLFRPMADAQGHEGDLMRSYVEKLNALIKNVPRKQAKDWGRNVDTPELLNKVSPDPALRGQPFDFGKDQIILMALNMGNAGNIQRLADGYGWDEQQVRGVLDRLMTEEDWHFVQGVWDAVEELKAPLFEMHRRVNGVEPDTVEAVPIETRFGTFRGGYFPAVYDPQYFTPEQINEVDKGRFLRASTVAGATKERAAKVKRPILLSMSVITNHMREVIHDITHREAVIQVSKILSSTQVRNAIDRKLGPEYLAALDGWLEDVARPNAPAANRIMRSIENVGRWLHKSVTVTGLGYRVSTALVQPLGLANLTGIIGERAVLEGMATFTAGQRATHNVVYDEVTSRSAEMRDRFSTMDASIAEMYRRHGSKLRTIGPKGISKYAFHGILYADLLITTGGWIGAFNKGLREGMTEEDATYYADKAIRSSQGSGAPKDRSAILRASKFVGAFIPFFTYLNAHYNQQRDIGRRVRNTQSISHAAETARRAWWIMVVPGLLSALVSGHGPDDDDEEGWAGYLSRMILIDNLSTLPGVGALANAVGNGWSYRATALQRSGEGLVRTARDIKASLDGDEDTQASHSWISNTLSTIGFLTGQPLAAPGATMQFLSDYSHGDAEPESAGDWYQGLTTGRVPAH